MLCPLFKVIEQNSNFIVINKSTNVNFHDEGNINKGLFNQVKNQLSLDELYPVHRLDKMTSGLILFAKNKETAICFQELFNEHNIEKYYLAISDKKAKKKQGLIKGDMIKSRRGAWKLLRTLNNPAVTQFFSYPLKNGLRLFVVKPHSGKTHQIRVALASIGAKILGDDIYSARVNNADRGYLHAYALRFNLAGRTYQYLAQPDQGSYFENIHEVMKAHNIIEPWKLAWPKIKSS